MVLGFLWIFLLGLNFFLVSGPLQCLQFTTRCNPLEEQQVARQRSRRLCHTPKIFQEDCGSMESESTWLAALPQNVQLNPRKLPKPDNQLSRAPLTSTFLPWTSWRADTPGGARTQLLGLVDSAPSMASSLLPTTNRMILLGRMDRHMHEWSLFPVGGTGRVVSTPNRRVDQCSGRTNLPWLLPGPVLWTVPQEALIGLDPEYILSTLKTTLAKVWQPRPSRLEYLRRRCILRSRQASFISTSILGVAFDQDAGRVDSAPGRLLSLKLHSEIAIVIVPNGQVPMEGRVVSTPNRRIVQRTHHSNPSWLPSGSVLWTLHYKGAGRVDSAPGRSPSSVLCHETATVDIPNGQVFKMGRVLPASYRRHRRIDKQSWCLRESCSAVAGHAETSNFTRWQQAPSHGEMGSQPRSLDPIIILIDNGAHLLLATTTTPPTAVHREFNMARKPLPDKAGPATHPPRTAVSAPRGRIPGTPINLPVRRDSTIRPANADPGTVAEGEGLNRGSPDSLDRALDAASDRDIDIDSAELWPSASEDEADRRCPQHSEASSSQQVVQHATADEHGAETGLRSSLPGWSVANDTPQDIGEGIHPRHATDATRMQDEGLRSPRLAPDGAKSSSKRSRRVAKMLVRSGLRCHCCFKLKHECEHRKAAILHANYRTLSCKRLLSLGPLLGFFFCPGSTGPGPWWLNLEPPCSRHSILATPGIFSHGCTRVRCEVGTGKVVSTPGGSSVLPPASISACRQPEHGRNQQASQVTQHDRSLPGQLGPHVCTHADKSLAAITYTQQTSCMWEPAFDSRQNFRAEPCRRSVRTWRGTSRWMTNRLSPWCPSPSNSSHQWKGGLQRSRSRSNPTKSKNHRPRSPGSMLMGPPVRGFQDRQAPYRETTPSGVQRCGRHLQDSSSLDFMVARTPSSTLFRHGLAVSAPWTIATAPGLQNDCECSARTSLHQQPPIILASAIRPYNLPGQVSPGRTINIHSRGKVVSTPGLDLRVQCMQLSPSFRWVRSLDLPTLHDQNISRHREAFARYGTQQHSWFCHKVRMGYIITPAHITGILSPTPSGNSTLRGPVRLSLAMVPSPSAKRKSSRRLPSYLRNQVGAEPVGELRRLREEAAQAAIERDRLHHEPSQPSRPSVRTGQVKTRGRKEEEKRSPRPGLSIGAGAGNDEPEPPTKSHGHSSSSSRKRLLEEPDEQTQTGRAKKRSWGAEGKRFPRPHRATGDGNDSIVPEQPVESHGPSSSSSRKRPLEAPTELVQDRESIIAAAERPPLKSRKPDETWNKDHVPRSGREARDRPRGGPEPGAASRPEESVLQTAETAPRRTGRPDKQESGARGQEAGSALAGIKMTQRREKLISHALSRILRHEAMDHDLPMNSAGYVPILDVVTVQSLWNHQVSPAEVHHAAQINKKQRFEIQTVNGVACIKAVQGHDQRLAAFYNLSDSEMLQLLELPRAPRYAIHGTMLKHYEAIKEGGLCRRQRRHIHFIEDTNAAEARIEDREASGLRAGSEIMLWVDIHKCLRCGMLFYRAHCPLAKTAGSYPRISSGSR